MFCNMTEFETASVIIPTCASVGGGWRRIVNISTGDDCPSGWHRDTYSGISYCHVVMLILFVPLQTSPLMVQVVRECLMFLIY